jgi:hypothetical protein
MLGADRLGAFLHAFVRAWQDSRRDAWPALAAAITWCLVADPLVSWAAARFAPALAPLLQAWGRGGRVAAFGIVPACALLIALVAPDLRRAWRRSAR